MHHFAIAIPACNEEAHVGAHLDSLAAAAGAGPRISVMVFANNCTDATTRVVATHARRHDLDLKLADVRLPQRHANAGSARRMAASLAARAFPQADILLTTDADCVLDPATFDAVAAEIGGGADMVCGRISTTLPAALAKTPGLRRHTRAAVPYAALLHEVRYAIDVLYGAQRPGRLPHYIESGACLALTRQLHQRIGGFPAVAVGEDRAVVRRAEEAGARVAYSDAAHALVSARLNGRARGGMAETIRARARNRDPLSDETLVAVEVAQAHWRAALAGLDHERRPPMPVAAPRLRTSALERDLSRLAAFVETELRPRMQALNGGAADTAMVA